MILLLYIELMLLVVVLLLFLVFSFSLSLLPLFVYLAEFKHQPYLSNNLTAIKNETVQPSHSIHLQAAGIYDTRALLMVMAAAAAAANLSFTMA